MNHNVRKDRLEIKPMLARTQNIGAEMGTYCPSAAWYRDNQFNEVWAGSVELVDGNFHEGSVRTLLPSISSI